MAAKKIENWSIVSTSDPYTPPELSRVRLHGNVYGHPVFDDGRSIVTSGIVGMDENNGIITESGSVYTLGVVSDEYEKQFPGSFERLKKTLKG